MAINLPSTADLIERNVSIFQQNLNRVIPALKRSFYRVLSTVLAMIETEIGKLLIYQAKENLITTASLDGLKKFGNEYELPIRVAVACVLTGTVTAETGKTLPASISFVSQDNGIRYRPDNSFSESGGLITATLTATVTGVSGNLEIGAFLNISSQLVGIGSILTVTSIDIIGADEEQTEIYRKRLLDKVRAVNGGGNATDYREWSLSVSGVVNAFPYSGKPYGTPGSLPGDRTVYVECDTSIDSDGIPPSTLLDQVREAIDKDPETGLDRDPLGMTDDNLWIEPISRLTIYFEVRGLDVAIDQESAIKTQIENALSDYARSLVNFIQGLDFEEDKNDTITDLTVSTIVQNIIASVGGDAEGVGLALTPGVFIPRYVLQPGETAKSGGVTYV